MLRQGIAMVIWSYLLLGLPARGASLENVLAPVTSLPAAAGTAPAHDTAALANAANEDQASRPLTTTRIDELDLLAELERQLSDKLQPAGRLRLVPTSTLPKLPATPTLPDIELLDHPSRLTSSSALLRFRLLEAGRLVGNYAVTFRVQVLADVWVPARRLAPGEVPVAADLVAREIDIVRESRAVPADPTIFGQYELARAVVPDRVLSWSDLQPRVLVRKGQVVEVVAQQGRLNISMKGQATRSGALGELVVIRNLESLREFSAEVIDENKVRVHF